MRHHAPSRPLQKLASSSLVWICLALGLLDCTSDHGKLARRSGSSGAAGTAGAGHAGSAGKSGVGGTAGSAGSSAPSAGTGGVKPVEPVGRAVTTLLHGVVDAERIAWCFGRGKDDPELFGRPTPRSGVEYGKSFAFEALDGAELEADDLSVLVLTGELELVRDLDCREAVALARKEMEQVAGAGGAGAGGEAGAPMGGEAGAPMGGEAGAPMGGAAGALAEAGAGGVDAAENAGQGGAASTTEGDAGQGGESGAPAAGGAFSDGGAGGSDAPLLPPAPRLRVATLASLPAGTLTEGYSLLLVAAGCIGGPAFSDAEEERVCGRGYLPRSGSLSANLVVLSRKTAANGIAFQALHAAHGAPERGVRVKPQDGLLPVISLADGMAEGTLRPREPRLDLGLDDYGIGLSGWTVEANASGTPLFEEPWSELSKRGGIDEFENGRGYTVVLIGPPDGGAGKWWNAAALTVVDNDPGGE